MVEILTYLRSMAYKANQGTMLIWATHSKLPI